MSLEPLGELFEPLLRDTIWSSILASMKISMFALDKDEIVLDIFDPAHPERAAELTSRAGLHADVAYRDVTMTLADGGSLSSGELRRRVLGGETLRGVLYSQQGAFDGQIVPLRALDGRCVGILGVCADITDRLKETERTLREQQLSSAVISHYEGLLDGVEDAIFSYDRRLVLTGLNAAAKRFARAHDDSLIGRHLHDAFPATRGSMFETAYQRVIATGDPQRFDYHDARNDRWLQLRAEPTALGVDVYVRDISAEHHTSSALSGFFSLSEQPMCVLEPRGHILSANPATQRALGVDEATLRGAYLLDFVHPDDRERARAALAHAARVGSMRDLIVRICAADGVTRDIGWSAVSAPDRVYLIGHEVTARLFSERLLAMNHEALEALARGIPVRHILLNLLRRAEELVPTLECALLHKDHAEELLCVGAPARFAWLGEVWDGRVAAGWPGLDEHALLSPAQLHIMGASPSIQRIAAIHRVQLGESRPIGLLCVLAPLIGALEAPQAQEVVEQVIRLAAVCLNRQRVERERSLLRAATTQINDIILLAQVRAPGEPPRILFANDAILRLVERPRDQVLGQPLWFFFDDEEARRAVETAVAAGSALRREVRRPAPGRVGGYQIFELDLLPLAPTAQLRGCWAMVVRDTSAQAHLNEELRRAQRMESVGLLTGGLAHDFNNLLTSIVGFTEFGIEAATTLVASGAVSGEASSLVMDLEEVHHAALRAGDLVRRLLAFSKHRFVQRAVFDVTASLIGMERMLRRLLPENVKLTLDIPRKPCMTQGDAGELEQVVMNLAINARDAMPDGGTLLLLLRSDEEHIALHVRDTGTGIDPASLPRIFDPFFTTKEFGRGSGLGLSMVQDIVQRMEGRIEVETALGAGTCFTVWLPRHHAPTPQLSMALDASSAAMGECVLVVEDDASVRQLTRRLLDAAGYQTRTARSAEQALELFEQEPEVFDVVVTDLVLCGMSGWELARRLRRRRPALPILLCSGYAPNPPDDPALRDLTILPKPFHQQELLRQLRYLLEGSSVTDDG
jgi:PAS domain S-box-containing protein